MLSFQWMQTEKCLNVHLAEHYECSFEFGEKVNRKVEHEHLRTLVKESVDEIL